MADWVPGSLLTALGCGAIYAVAPSLLLPAFPVSLRLGFVLWQAAEGEPRRVWKLWKELSSSIWFFAARVPLASRTAWYYHLRPPPHLVKDIDFGSPHHAGRNRLDVYFPGDAGGRHAVVLFVYGGAWSSGDKAMYALVGATLRRHGLVAVIPNYSIYPTGSMAEMVDDVSFAVGWTVQHVARYGGDPRRMYIVGHSAGGHLALSTVLRRWCDDHNLDLLAALPPPSLPRPPAPPLTLLPHLGGRRPPRLPQAQRRPLEGTAQWQLSDIRAVISMGAPLDIVEHFEFERQRSVHLLSGMLPATDGDPEAHSCRRLVELIASMPTGKPSVSDVPEVHLLHSTEDTVVPVLQATRFWHALQSAGISSGPRAVLCTGTHSRCVEDIMHDNPDGVAVKYLVGIVAKEEPHGTNGS